MGSTDLGNAPITALLSSIIFIIGVTLPIVIALLLLNGTRQYLAAGAILILLIWIGSLRQKVYFMFGVGCMIAVTTASFIESVVDTEAGRRLSSSGVREEMYDSRGQIWADALASGGKNFLQGVGFRQFGDILIRREETGEVYEYRDEAHGVFQNIIAEQGYLIGLMMLGMFILALSAIFRNGWVEHSDDSYRSIFSIATHYRPNWRGFRFLHRQGSPPSDLDATYWSAMAAPPSATA